MAAELSATLAEDLSAMMNGPAIYDKQRFADVPMSGKLRKRIGQAMQANALVHANRLALEAALDKDVAQRLIKKRVQKWINLKGACAGWKERRSSTRGPRSKEKNTTPRSIQWTKPEHGD